jgi:hypothetical protein
VRTRSFVRVLTEAPVRGGSASFIAASIAASLWPTRRRLEWPIIGKEI